MFSWGIGNSGRAGGQACEERRFGLSGGGDGGGIGCVGAVCCPFLRGSAGNKEQVKQTMCFCGEVALLVSACAGIRVGR